MPAFIIISHFLKMSTFFLIFLINLIIEGVKTPSNIKIMEHN